MALLVKCWRVVDALFVYRQEQPHCAACPCPVSEAMLGLSGLWVQGAEGPFAGKWGGTSSRSIWGRRSTSRSTALIPLMYQPSYKIYSNDKAWKTLCTSHQHLYLVLVLIVELIRRIRRSGFYPLGLEVVCTIFQWACVSWTTESSSTCSWRSELVTFY